MGSNCCKGDAGGRPIRSNSSIYSRYFLLAITILQEFFGVPWVLRPLRPSRAGASLDGRFTATDDAGGVRLTVSNARTGDTNVYTLQASNAAGSDTSQVRLEVCADEAPTGEDPPTFLRRLQDLTVKVGTRTRFLVEIVSSTECKVTWFRNERRLLEAERVALARDGNFWCADVATVSVDDAGRWTCTAENAGGRASCSAHLNVLVPKAYKRPEFVEELRALLTEQGTVSLECKVVGVPTPVLRWFKDSCEIKAGDVFALTANAEDPTSLGTYTCEAVNCMGRAYSSSKVHVVGRGSREGSARPSSSVTPEPPPIFTKELEEQFVKICEPLILGCHIVVPPWPRSVVWYNKEGKIEPSERYHVIEDGAGGYVLEVPSAEWPDEGEWKCVATSTGGRVGISTCYVTMDVPKNYRKPRFMENLQAVLTEEGLVSFECKVVGFPTPVLSWFKDGQELKPGDVYQLTGTNSLGSYCCIARNCMGQASSSAELTVEDIQNQLNEEEKLQLFSKNQAPKFIQGLKSVEAKIDEPFRFTVKVAIPPEPSVLWYRDDQPVDESSRCHHGREERGMFYLDIQSLEFLDQAEWKCVAMNDFGHSVTSCFLKLIIPRHYKKPRFLENLQAILSDEGAVNLECKVIGVPQPVLKWYKDGEELKPGDIHRIISGQDGTCCLGTYTCEAQNCMGIAASSASLLGFDDSMKAKKKKAEEQALQRNLSLSTIHEERTSQMYDTPVGDVTTLDDKGEISFSFDGKEVSVSLYETPDLTEEEALQIVEMYADQLSENITEHNVVELPPLRFVKETSTSGNLLMEAVIIDVSPEYFVSPDEDMRTEADIEDISIADENGPPQLSLDQEIEIGGEDYLEKTMAMLPEEKSDISLRQSRKKSDSQKSADDFFSLSRDQSLSEEKRDDDTQAISDLQSFASAHSSGKPKSSKPSGEDGQESSEPTKTILFKDEAKKLSLEAESSSVVKPKRERRSSRSSRRSSSGSEKSVTRSKETLLKKESIDIELPQKPTITDEEFKDKMASISISLAKVINDIQIIERDIILKSELMSSAATASRSLEIISSLISPLSEIHSITDAVQESVSESKEVSSTLFTNLPQPLKSLHQSLTIIEKCIDMESDSKTLVKKTCVAFIETCGSETQKIFSDINYIASKDYLLTEETVLTEIESLNNEISTVIKFSADTIKARNLLSEACEIKVDEPSLEVKHLRETQKAVFELKSPLNSLLCIAESAEGGKIVDVDKVRNSEVILNDMSGSIQDLQTALEQIETLSVKESTLSLHKYNTGIIETVMESIVKLRSSFEQLSMEPEGEDKIVLKQAVASIKENLNKISSQIEVIEMNVGNFDVLQSDNKLDALQKMAQILITLENNLPRLETMPEVKNNMTVFHKNLTKVLENVIESNESNKYFTLMATCDAVSRINASIKNLDVDNLLPLASMNNTLRIIQDQFITNVFNSELNCSILTNIADTLIGIQDAINTAKEISTQIDSERIQDLTPLLYDETKAKVVVEHIDHAIAAIENVKLIESTQELKLSLAPVLENICPVLEELKRNVASIKVSESKEEHLSEISEISSFVQTLATPLCELNQNIIIINQQLVENISSLKENSEFVAKFAEPLHELHTTLEVLQQDIISQYGEDLTSYELNLTMASAVQNLQSCIVMIREQAGIDAADEISTLEDISIIKTTADTIPSDRLVLPATEETAVEQAISTFNQDMQTTATAQALHTLNEHITVLQSPDIIDALDTLSEVSDYSSLKSFVVGLGELHSGIEEILHPLLMEGSDEIANLINTSKLAAIAEPMQELQQSLSVLDTSNIPIYENLLEMPTERIHSVIQSVTEFKEHLDNCMLALFPSLHTGDNTVEIANKVGALREVCEHLKDIIETTKTVDNISMPKEVKILERTVDSLLDATDVSKGIKIEQVKTITEELYEKVAIVQDEMIQFTPQSPEKLAQEAKLIQTIDEVQNNIAVLEQYDFVDLSRTSDLMCTSPQVAAEIESDSLMLMEDIADSAVNVMQDSTQDMPIADLMIVEDFFKTCKNEFTILRCLISKATSHKKIIRLLQEFNSLQSTINDFKTKRFELTLSDDINGCLATFLIHADDCLQNVQTSLIKIVNSQAELLVEAPLAKFENSTSVLKAAKETKQDEQIIETVNKFVEILETAKPSLQNAQTIVLDEIMAAKSPVTDDSKLVDKIEEFALFVESAKTQIKDIETKGILEKVSACIEKHQDFKDASRSGKSLILLKCLSDCTDVLQESLLEVKVPKQKVEEGPLKAVLTEMLEPLHALHSQLITVQEQVLRGVDEDSISVDITTTESLVQTMTEKHKEIIECIETEAAIANEEISLIMEVDKEIHSIQHSLRSIENVQVAQIVKEIAKPVEDIEKSMHCILSEKVSVYSEDKLPKDANSNISSLENALNRFVNVESYLLDTLTTTCNVDLNKCLQIAGELKELLALDSEKPASSKITEIKNIKKKSLKDILSKFDWQNTDVYNGKNQLETEKIKNIILVACQLLAELDKVELDYVEVNEDKAKQIIQHIDQYIELIEIIEEISAVIQIGDIKETMEIAKELRESIVASEIIAEEEESLKNASEVREKQTRLAEKLQTALSALQVQVLDSAQELAPTLSVEVLQRIAKVTAQLQADLVAVTGIQVALQAPAEAMGEVTKTIEVDKAHASASVTELSTEVLQSKPKILEQVSVVEQLSSSEQLLATTEMLEKTIPQTEEVVASEDANILSTEILTESAQSNLEPAVAIEGTQAVVVEQVGAVSTELISKEDANMTLINQSQAQEVASVGTLTTESVSAVEVEDLGPVLHEVTIDETSVDIGIKQTAELQEAPKAMIDILVQHIDQFVSDYITEVITEISCVINAEELKESICIAKELRENIAASEVLLKAETSDVLKSEVITQQAQLAQQLYIALAALETLSLDTLSEVPSINKETLQQVAEITENLRADLAAVTAKQNLIGHIEEVKPEKIALDTDHLKTMEPKIPELTAIDRQISETSSAELTAEESVVVETKPLIQDAEVKENKDKTETIVLFEPTQPSPKSADLATIGSIKRSDDKFETVEPMSQEPHSLATTETLLQNINEFLSHNIVQTIDQIVSILNIEEPKQCIAVANDLRVIIAETADAANLVKPEDSKTIVLAQQLQHSLSSIQFVILDSTSNLTSVIRKDSLQQLSNVTEHLYIQLAAITSKDQDQRIEHISSEGEDDGIVAVISKHSIEKSLSNIVTSDSMHQEDTIAKDITENELQTRINSNEIEKYLVDQIKKETESQENIEMETGIIADEKSVKIFDKIDGQALAEIVPTKEDALTQVKNITEQLDFIEIDNNTTTATNEITLENKEDTINKMSVTCVEDYLPSSEAAAIIITDDKHLTEKKLHTSIFDLGDQSKLQVQVDSTPKVESDLITKNTQGPATNTETISIATGNENKELEKVASHINAQVQFPTENIYNEILVVENDPTLLQQDVTCTVAYEKENSINDDVNVMTTITTEEDAVKSLHVTPKLEKTLTEQLKTDVDGTTIETVITPILSLENIQLITTDSDIKHLKSTKITSNASVTKACAALEIGSSISEGQVENIYLSMNTEGVGITTEPDLLKSTIQANSDNQLCAEVHNVPISETSLCEQEQSEIVVTKTENKQLEQEQKLREITTEKESPIEQEKELSELSTHVNAVASDKQLTQIDTENIESSKKKDLLNDLVSINIVQRTENQASNTSVAEICAQIVPENKFSANLDITNIFKEIIGTPEVVSDFIDLPEQDKVKNIAEGNNTATFSAAEEIDVLEQVKQVGEVAQESLPENIEMTAAINLSALKFIQSEAKEDTSSISSKVLDMPVTTDIDPTSKQKEQKINFEQGALIEHIERFVSDETKQLVNKIPILTNSQELKESMELAKVLKETIEFTNLAEEPVSMEEAKMQQAKLTQMLQNALSMLQTKTIESAEDITSTPKLDALQKVTDLLIHLQEDLQIATVSGSPKILQKMESASIPETDKDSMTQLKVLLQEVTDKINLTTDRSADDTEALRDCLDEVQTVIIKLKHDYDGAAADTLNETLEDLECSVRSVQLQINEDSPSELLKEACATLQLLVSNMSETQEVLVIETVDNKNENILEKCSYETDETLKLLDLVSKVEIKDDNLAGIVSNLGILKETIKSLKLSFVGNADVLIEKGIDVVQSLNQLEDKVFALEKDLAKVSISTGTRDHILTAIHAIFGSISNMRGTILSTQKRYMFENYGKPSEILLRSIKNMSSISELDEANKNEWKTISKSLRKVLNHFEDIKFYINLDKTARLPSDAAFTKIILEELNSTICEILVPQASILGVEAINKVENLLNCVKANLENIEPKPTLEVKEKIPIFKVLSLHIVDVTDFIKTKINELYEDTKSSLSKQIIKVPLSMEEKVTHEIISNDAKTLDIATISQEIAIIDKIDYISEVVEETVSVVPSTAEPTPEKDIKTKVKPHKQVLIQDVEIKNDIEQIAYEFVDEIASNAIVAVQNLTELVSYEDDAENMARLIETDILEEVQACQIDVNDEKNVPTTEEISILQSKNEENTENMAQSGETDILQPAQIDVSVEESIPTAKEILTLLTENVDNAENMGQSSETDILQHAQIDVGVEESVPTIEEIPILLNTNEDNTVKKESSEDNIAKGISEPEACVSSKNDKSVSQIVQNSNVNKKELLEEEQMLPETYEIQSIEETPKQDEREKERDNKDNIDKIYMDEMETGQQRNDMLSGPSTTNEQQDISKTTKQKYQENLQRESESESVDKREEQSKLEKSVHHEIEFLETETLLQKTPEKDLAELKCDPKEIEVLEASDNITHKVNIEETDLQKNKNLEVSQIKDVVVEVDQIKGEIKKDELKQQEEQGSDTVKTTSLNKGKMTDEIKENINKKSVETQIEGVEVTVEEMRDMQKEDIAKVVKDETYDAKLSPKIEASVEQKSFLLEKGEKATSDLKNEDNLSEKNVIMEKVKLDAHTEEAHSFNKKFVDTGKESSETEERNQQGKENIEKTETEEDSKSKLETKIKVEQEAENLQIQTSIKDDTEKKRAEEENLQKYKKEVECLEEEARLLKKKEDELNLKKMEEVENVIQQKANKQHTEQETLRKCDDEDEDLKQTAEKKSCAKAGIIRLGKEEEEAHSMKEDEEMKKVEILQRETEKDHAVEENLKEVSQLAKEKDIEDENLKKLKEDERLKEETIENKEARIKEQKKAENKRAEAEEARLAKEKETEDENMRKQKEEEALLKKELEEKEKAAIKRAEEDKLKADILQKEIDSTHSEEELKMKKALLPKEKEESEKKHAEEEKIRLQKGHEEVRFIKAAEEENKLTEEEKNKGETRLAKVKEIAEENIKRKEEEERLKKEAEDKEAAERKKQQKAEKQRVKEEKARLDKEKEAEEGNLRKQKEENACLKPEAEEEEKAEKKRAEDEKLSLEREEGEASLIKEAEEESKAKILQQETENKLAEEEKRKEEARLAKEKEIAEENIKQLEEEERLKKAAEDKEAAERKKQQKAGKQRVKEEKARLAKAKEAEEENLRKQKEEETRLKTEAEEREKTEKKRTEDEKLSLEREEGEARLIKEAEAENKAKILQQEMENKLAEEEKRKEEAHLAKEKEIAEENIKQLEEEERLKKAAEDKEAAEIKKQQKAEKQRVEEEKARLAKEKEAEEENLTKQKEEETRLKIETEEKEKADNKRAEEEKIRLEKEEEEASLIKEAEEENKVKILQQETENKLAEEERRKEEARLATEKEIAEENIKQLKEEERLKKAAEDKEAAEKKKQQKAEKQRVKEEKARLAKEKEAEEENLRKQIEEETRLKIEAEEKEKADNKRAEEEKIRLEKEEEKARLIKEAEEENKAKILQQETENKLTEEERRKEEARLATEKEIAEKNIKQLKEEERLKKAAEDKEAAEIKKQQKAEKQRVKEEKARLAKEKEAEEENLRKQKEEETRLKIEAEEQEKADNKRAEEEKIRLEKEEKARLIEEAEEENKAMILQQEMENKLAEEEKRKEKALLANEKEIAEENIKQLEEEESLKKEAEDREAAERKKQQKAEKQCVEEEKARLAKEKEAEEENLRKQQEEEVRLKTEAEEQEKAENKRAEEEKIRLEKEEEKARLIKEAEEENKAKILQQETENKLAEEERRKEEAFLAKEKEIAEENIKQLEEEERLKKVAEDKEAAERKKQQKAEKQRVKEEKARLAKEKEAEEENLRKQEKNKENNADEKEQAETEKQKKEKKHTGVKMSEKEENTNEEKEEVLSKQESEVIKRVGEETIKQDGANKNEKSKKYMAEDEKAKNKISKQKQKGQQEKPCDQIKTDNSENEEEFEKQEKKKEIVIQGKETIDKEVTVDAKIQQQEKSINSTEEERSIKEFKEKNSKDHEDALKLEQKLDKTQTGGMKGGEVKDGKESEKREKAKKVSEKIREQDKIKQEEEYKAKKKDENHQKDVEKREKEVQEAKRKEEIIKQEEAEKLEQENKKRARLETVQREEELRQAEERTRQEKKKVSKRAKEEHDARLNKEAEEAEQARKDSIRKKKDKEKVRLLKEQAEAEEREQEIRETERIKREERRRQIEEELIEKKLSAQELKPKREENGVVDSRHDKEDHYIREYQYEPTKQKSDDRSKFVDHNHRDYTMEFLRPSGYRDKSFEHERFSERESLGKCATIYKAQTLILDAQLRSSAPPQPERHEPERKIDRFDRSDSERRIERHRSKALSEARSIISEKRCNLSRDLKRKPVFSTYLTDRTAVEGSRVKLTCSVLSSSDPKIIWYRNGVLLDDKLKYRTKFLDGLITLEVLNAVVSDSAEYTCTAENDNGSVSTSANLKVYPSFEASPIPPTFTRSIRDTYHLAENELVLECRIRGQPLPTITWLKDDKPVSINERYQAYYLADGVCRLAISAPTPEDSGKYTCKAENSVWSDQITHVVSFTGKECRLSPNIATIERSRFNRQALESRRPHFSNVLSDYKVAKGGTIGLQVEIRGYPTRVEWLREGRSVTEVYRNARTFVEQGLYTLALSDVTEKESGLYTCRAWSTHGNVDMNAAITVVPPTELEGKPAILVGRPEKDILISVGEDVNISFRVQGEPKPKVVFMKGIRDITTSQRVCKMTSDDYVKFTLKRSIISDAGTYCILARNAYGCDRAFVTVVIRQRASSENLISDWTYPTDDSALSIAERKYKSVPDRIPGEPSIVDGGNNWVSLAWPKADPRDSAPVLAYKIESWLLGKEGGARWIELGITPLNSFDAFNLKQGEEYHFRVTPKNRYGWGESVQTSTPVGIGLAGDRPEFVEILPGQLKVLAGETANLSCSVKGKPLPEVVWMKNGHEIEEDSRMTTLFNGQDCSLTIKDICIEDEARYSCEASNANGRASTYARLAVVTDRLVWEADAKLKRERSQDAEGDYPPQFTMRLRDRRVQATYPVRLTCQVVGSPPPTLTWFKEGELLVFDSRRNNYQDEHFHTLEIAPTTLEDGGIYEAMARNSSGAVSCRCSLVVDKGIRAYVAPEFCCGLEPLYRLTEGEELRISAVVEAYPSVGVTWYRDGVRLRPSRRAIMTLDRDGQIELALASVTARDAGVYTCTASNEVGRASTSGKVDIIVGHEPREKKTPPVLINAPDVPYSKEPMFICKPRSSEAREGDTVIIACEVIGDPKPDVYWLRDFLKPDYYRDATHFKRVGDGPEYRFEIPHAKLDYTGAYSVVARNVHGEAKAIISLQILAKDPSSTDDSHNVRYGRVEVIPRFERELTDLLSYDGDAIEFECIVTGNPEPDIRWFHYNELIRDCADFESSFDEGAARLKIKQVTADDEGTYSCEASNNLGKATSSACLVVYPPGEPNTLSQRLRRPPALLSAASTPRSTPRSTPARSVSRTPGPDVRRLCSPSRQMAPSFYTYPFNKVVEEGENVTFKCAVKGQPAPWATWDKDGIIITPSARITIKEKEEVLRILEIEQVSIEDVGIYRITVENEFGRAEASARLEVITQKGKFYGGIRAYSASPRKSLTYRRYPSVPRQD